MSVFISVFYCGLWSTIKDTYKKVNMEYRQVVRPPFLVRLRVGSNPSIPIYYLK